MDIKRKELIQEKKEKKKLAGDAVRKVSKKLDFSSMQSVIVDGELRVPVKSEVFFERTKEGKTFVCVGTIVSVYPNGGVDVWDETNNEFFLFNYKKHSDVVKVRAFEIAEKSVKHEHVVLDEHVENNRIKLYDTIENTEQEEAHVPPPSGPTVQPLPEPTVRPEIKPVPVAIEAPTHVEQNTVHGSVGGYKLFLDDERSPPDESWVLVKSSQAARNYVREHGYPTEMSLDHDLGMGDTSMKFIRWLEYTNAGKKPPKWSVHSQNPVGAKNIVAFMTSWEKVSS